MEEEARRILASAVDEGSRNAPNVADAIAALTDPIGGMPLDVPPRFSERSQILQACRVDLKRASLRIERNGERSWRLSGLLLQHLLVRLNDLL